MKQSDSPGFQVTSLETTPIETIHAAFVDAFSEYEVKIDMPLAKLQEMLLTRSYLARHSLGCFCDGVLAGFVLVGVRTIGGQQEGYDIATGTVRDFQKTGVGSLLVKTLTERLPGWRFRRFWLEVLANNEAARKLYMRNGFMLTRSLNCYALELAQADLPDTPLAESDDPDLLSKLDIPSWLGFRPSWQNDLVSFRNM